MKKLAKTLMVLGATACMLVAAPAQAAVYQIFLDEYGNIVGYAPMSSDGITRCALYGQETGNYYYWWDDQPSQC